MHVERQGLVLQEQEDERRGEHQAQQAAAAESNERDADRHLAALLDEPNHRVHRAAPITKNDASGIPT